MPVPDNTIFGEKPEGGFIKYAEARNITKDQHKLEILKSRIDPWLIRQVEELSYKDGLLKVYAPFPLTVLTLIGIETLGNIINDIEKINKTSAEPSKEIVTPIYYLMDKKLSYKPTKPFYEAFERVHGKVDEKINKYSDVIHKYQRNTFIHGYQSRGVYLTEEINAAIIIDEAEGHIYLNPYSFWVLFKNTYESVFVQILRNKNKEWRNNALKYFTRLIS